MDLHPENNKIFAELAGIHICNGTEPISDSGAMRCAECGMAYHPMSCVQNFAADPRLVLKEMRKRKDWQEFLKSLPVSDEMTVECLAGGWHGITVVFAEDFIDYILDTTGRWRDAAIEWMKK